MKKGYLSVMAFELGLPFCRKWGSMSVHGVVRPVGIWWALLFLHLPNSIYTRLQGFPCDASCYYCWGFESTLCFQANAS
jgi:hypothetical protein